VCSEVGKQERAAVNGARAQAGERPAGGGDGFTHGRAAGWVIESRSPVAQPANASRSRVTRGESTAASDGKGHTALQGPNAANPI